MKKLILVQERDIGDGRGFIFKTAEDGLPVLVADKKLKDKYDGKQKLKVGISLSSGCGVKCIYCFTNNYKHYRPLTADEIMEQARFVLALPENSSGSFDEVKISCKQMGDPALNFENTCEAIEQLSMEFPTSSFVVSTSGPSNISFFERLQTVVNKGANVRLQFSCHTTSDMERSFLSPAIKMMTFAEIAKEVKRWNGSIVTLNFVMLEGFSYDSGAIERNFDPKKVFIKVNYLDPNTQLKKNGLRDMRKEDVNKFTEALKIGGFQYAFRH